MCNSSKRRITRSPRFCSALTTFLRFSSKKMEIAENQEAILDLSIVKEEYIVQDDDVSPLDTEKDKNPVNLPKNGVTKGRNAPEKKHICAICGKAFRHRRDIRYHITIHSKERKHRCPRCKKTFTDERRMMTHMKIHSDGQHHQCKLCWKTFPVADYLKIHLRRHIGIRNYECEYCGKMFLENRSRKFHILRCHEEAQNGELPNNRFTCQHCGRISIDNIAHELHLVSHSDVRSVECPLCLKKFKHQVHLRYHLTVHRIERSYVCFVCNKAFKSSAQLRQHTVRHQNRVFDCPYCPKTYKEKDTCKRHVWNHHRGLPLDIKEGANSCTACQQVFDNMEKLKVHAVIHADEKPFQCAICKKDFVDKRKHRTHMRLQHERAEALNKIIHCPQCGKGCRGKAHLFLHQATHADEAQFECAICSKKFKLKSHLTNHVIRHSRERPLYTCKICGAKRTSLRSVRHHESTHKPGEKKLKCPVKLCRRIFNKNLFLNEHIAKSHKQLWDTIRKPRKPPVKREPGVKKPKVRRHVCSICGKAFYHPRDVRSHMSIHSTERNFPCQKCPKAFTSHLRMTTHLDRVHADDGGPYFCDLCGKVFQIQEYLKIHLKRHTGENARECLTCGRKFADLRNLRHHIMRFHEEEDIGGFPKNQFTCDFCGKHCVDKKSYEGHILVHSDVKTVLCPQCPKTFKCEDYLRNHMKVHSDEKPFWCVICHAAYKQRGQFKNHLEGRHRGFPVDLKDGPMSCTACHEVFDDLKALKEHILIHAEERPYECSVCGKGFKEMRILRTHILELHERKDKPNKILKCPQCGKGCRGKTFLAQHLASHITDALFECAICSKKFKLKTHIKHHVVRHSKERKKYTCKICGIKFLTVRCHRTHEAKHKTGERLLNCLAKDCKEVFKKKVHLTEHIANVHKDFRYECKICGAKIKHAKYVRQHEANHSRVKKEKIVKIKTESVKDEPQPKKPKEKRHVCDICKKAFYHRRDVRYHMSIHFTEKKIPCPKCQKLFADERRMITHMRIHADGQPHQCKLCWKIFGNPEYLRLHLQRHIDAKIHECKVCGTKFASSRSLKHHMLRLHDGADIAGLQKFTCELCGKVFGNSLYLKYHQIVHSDVRNFECSECLKKFKTNGDLKKHIRLHNDVKSSVCVICGKEYKCRASYRAHMRTQHRGIPFVVKDGPISCSACKEVFEDLKTLKAHIPIHADDKPYTCPVCDKGFKEKRVMKTHLQTIHQGKIRKRAVKCPQCGESCLGYHNLAIHRAIHSNIDPFECVFCSRKFITKRSIARHMMKHNKELKLKQVENGRKYHTRSKKNIPIEIKSENEDSHALTVIDMSDTIKIEI